MEVFFCDLCSRRVSEGDLAEGRAIRVGDYCFCGECWKKPEVRAAARSWERGHRAAPGSSGLAGGFGTDTPDATTDLRKSPHRGLARARARTRAGLPSRPTRHGHRWTPLHARPRRSRTLATLVLCVVVGMGLGLLLMWLLSSGKRPGTSPRAPVSVTGGVNVHHGDTETRRTSDYYGVVFVATLGSAPLGMHRNVNGKSQPARRSRCLRVSVVSPVVSRTTESG